MKKLLTTVLLSILLCSPYIFPKLSKKETAFIEMHKVSDEEQTIIDEIFGNLDPALVYLLNGRAPIKTNLEYKKLFEQANFTVYNLRIYQKKILRIDAYPKRAILKHEKLPDYFIKIGFDLEYPQKNISRVMYADIINSLIDNPDLNITTIKKIHKKLCLRPGHSNEDLIDTNYIVLSPEQKGILGTNNCYTKNEKTKDQRYVLQFDSEKQIKDCSLLRERICAWDFTGNNLIFTDDGKIAFIDTEIVQDHIIDSFFEKIFTLTD